MQKKLTVLFAFAIFMLLIGWTITPAQANPPDQNGRHNHGGGGGGSDTGFEPAFVDLDGGMFTMNFPVSVIQDNFKKIHFENQNFNFTSSNFEIRMNFEIPQPQPDDEDTCFVSRGVVDPQELIAFVDVLNTAVIKSGSFVVEVDKKKHTGILVIQYTHKDLGQIRIKYGMGAGFAPDVREEIEGTFTFDGTIIVWLTELNNADQQIVACRNQTVDVTLTSSAGQQ